MRGEIMYYRPKLIKTIVTVFMIIRQEIRYFYTVKAIQAMS